LQTRARLRSDTQAAREMQQAKRALFVEMRRSA
jgi:hypothetical protein